MIEAILYKRPNGNKEAVTIRHVDDEDAFYINQNNVAVSMEDTPMGPCLYFNDGAELEDGTPDELCMIAKNGESCNSLIKRSVEILRKRKELHP